MPSKLLGKLASALRGDKYMVGAYPPEWQGSAPAPHVLAQDETPVAVAGTERASTSAA